MKKKMGWIKKTILWVVGLFVALMLVGAIGVATQPGGWSEAMAESAQEQEVEKQAEQDQADAETRRVNAEADKLEAEKKESEARLATEQAEAVKIQKETEAKAIAEQEAQEKQEKEELAKAEAKKKQDKVDAEAKEKKEAEAAKKKQDAEAKAIAEQEANDRKVSESKEKDTVYLTTVKHFIPELSGAGDTLLIDAGKSVCGTLDAGFTLSEVGYQAINEGFSAEQAGYLIGAAVAGYCPNHQSKIDNF